MPPGPIPFWLKSTWIYKIIFKILWSRQRLIYWIAKRLDGRVAGGFAKGMHYPPEVVWGNPGNKLVGTYEKELMPYWRELDATPPAVVFDVGAAEGYYAVGSALRWPGTTVYAWEADDRSVDMLRANAVRNDVMDSIHVAGMCSEPTLYEAITQYGPDLIIMDVEGEEVRFCSTRCIQETKQAVWIVECHDEEIVQSLKKQFKSTHLVGIVHNQPRTADDFQVQLPWYCMLSTYDRWRLVHEGRPFPTPWLVAKPKREQHTG